MLKVVKAKNCSTGKIHEIILCGDSAKDCGESVETGPVSLEYNNIDGYLHFYCAGRVLDFKAVVSNGH